MYRIGWAVLLVLVVALGGSALPGPSSQVEQATVSLTPVPTVTPGPLVPPAATQGAAVLISSLEDQITHVYGSAGPGVVNITSRSYAYGVCFQPVPQEGSGSGFVYDTSGHIVTNFHVIEGASEL